MPEDLKPFRIIKEFSPLNVLSTGISDDWDLQSIGTITNEGWTKLGPSFFMNRQTIDLHGLTAEERTMFFSTQFLQRPTRYSTTMDFATSGGLTLTDQFIISDTPLDDITGTVPDNARSFQAGFNSSPDDYITIKLAEGVVMAQNNAIPLVLSMVDAYNFGSGEPTASNKLYCYRFVDIDTTNVPIAPGSLIELPGVRYVGVGVTTKEKSLVWMQRMKRAFEIQNQSLS